jgi:putative membrane protein
MVAINPSEIIIEKSMRLIARGLAARRLKTVASGLENIPDHGPALIAARHYHHLFDGLALFAAIPRRIHIVVTLDWAQNQSAKLFFATINRLARWPTLLRSDAFDRRAGDPRGVFSQHDIQRYQHRAVKQSVDLLVEGRLLVIFPEGYPNIDPIYTPKTGADQFLPFKPGFIGIVSAARRKLQREIPIIPAGLHYKQGNPWTCCLRFGRPIYLDTNRGKEDVLSYIEKTVKRLSVATP